MLLSCTIFDFHFFIFKHEPLWQEVSVKSLILGWPLRPVDLLFWFDIDLPFLTRRGITINRCVANMFLCPANNYFWFDIGIPYLAHGSSTMRGSIKYIHDPVRRWPLTSTSNNRVYDIALCSGLSFFILWHSHTFIGTLVYHHGTMCRIHSLTLYELALWPQYQNYIFTLNLSLARCLRYLT